MSATDDFRRLNPAATEAAAWAISLPIFLMYYVLASVSEILEISIVGWIYPFLFYVIIPLLFVAQAVVSPTARGAVLRLVFVTTLLAVGLWDSDIWQVLGKAWPVLVLLGLGYVVLFFIARTIARFLQAKSERLLISFVRLARRPAWMKCIWACVPILAFIIAISMKPVLIAAFSEPPPFKGGLRTYSILPSHIKCAVLLNWVGFVVFSVSSITGFLLWRRTQSELT